MQIRNSLFILTTLGLFVQSCSKKGLELYDEPTNGSSIYFKEAIAAKSALIRNISFGFVGYSITDSVVSIPVAVTGSPSDHDRPFQLKVTDSTTAIVNQHYTFLRPPVIRAGMAVDTLLLKIHRTADMASNAYRLDLLLEQNSAFTTKLGDTSKIYLKYKVLMDDVAGVSYLWTTYARRAAVISYFGAYSRKKVDLMMEVLNLQPAFFYDPAANTLTSTLLLSYGRYMYYWLNKEAAAGHIYLDENSSEIKMGQLAN